MTYVVGQRVALSTTIRNQAGTAVDATVVLTLTAPDGTVTAPTVSHDGVGLYSAQVTLDQAGDWLRVWSSSGAAITTDVDQLHVIAPALRIVGLDEVKQHGNITSTTADRELLDFIGTAQQMIEGQVGAVVPTAVVETHTAVGNVLWLRNPPVLSITSVTEYAGAVPYAALSSTSWVLDTDLGTLTRAYGCWAGTTVQVVYRAGRLPIPEAIRWGAKELTIHLWRATQAQRGGRGRGVAGDAGESVAALGYALPNRVTDVLLPFKKGPAVY